MKVELFWFAAAAAMCSSPFFCPFPAMFVMPALWACYISSRMLSQHPKPCDTSTY